MAFTYGFYNSVGGDRKYNAEQVSELFDGLITDGVFATIGEFFSTIPGDGLSVVVKTGRAWFNHTWNKNDSYITFQLSPADPTLSRYDAVVLEVNETTRTNSIKVLSGEPGYSPVKPSLVATDAVHQYVLAYILVGANVTTINGGNIDIRVGQPETPWVTGIVKGVDIEDLFQQWDAEFEAWLDGAKVDFEAWYANIKAQLAGDVATNLQKQIDERVKIADKASEQDVAAGTSDTLWVTPKGVKEAVKKQVQGEGLAVGDIFKTTRNLESETNGKFVAMDGRNIKYVGTELENESGSLENRLPYPTTDPMKLVPALGLETNYIRLSDNYLPMVLSLPTGYLNISTDRLSITYHVFNDVTGVSISTMSSTDLAMALVLISGQPYVLLRNSSSKVLSLYRVNLGSLQLDLGLTVSTLINTNGKIYGCYILESHMYIFYTDALSNTSGTLYPKVLKASTSSLNSWESMDLYTAKSNYNFGAIANGFEGRPILAKSTDGNYYFIIRYDSSGSNLKQDPTYLLYRIIPSTGAITLVTTKNTADWDGNSNSIFTKAYPNGNWYFSTGSNSDYLYINGYLIRSARISNSSSASSASQWYELLERITLSNGSREAMDAYGPSEEPFYPSSFIPFGKNSLISLGRFGPSSNANVAKLNPYRKINLTTWKFEPFAYEDATIYGSDLNLQGHTTLRATLRIDDRYYMVVPQNTTAYPIYSSKEKMEYIFLIIDMIKEAIFILSYGPNVTGINTVSQIYQLSNGEVYYHTVAIGIGTDAYNQKLDLNSRKLFAEDNAYLKIREDI